MDLYQGTLQHQSITAQSQPRDPCLYEYDIDHKRSWVMLNQKGEIQPLEDEQILLRTPGYVSLELSVPKALRTANSNFNVKCDSGVAYVTNRRIIYLAEQPTETFQSFSAFILDTYDPQPRAGGLLGFGAWRWRAEAKPRAGGGIPGDVPRIEILLIFNHGGVEGFHSKYSLMFERLAHARDVARETGTRITVHDDDLPPYSAAEAGDAPGQQSGQTSSAPAQSQPEAPAATQQPQPTPNEPPPDYDEAQAQAVEQQFEERDRQDAERAQ
ncbi:hypothetical protein J7T55_013641 [Diaporthe amygdali]|uniref:uncharacterized protein n=1 Tax=Phomopsis amygdali TaxID=1214568 RepID=UPI0022FE7863|nr:uncharacterized protein J7T55_013641 [Diaporthe amygdali]KAJ0119440.1 hypothetical protein J7T55_013641 [Diaporthe amygdali]